MELNKIDNVISFRSNESVKNEPVKQEVVHPQITEKTEKIASDAVAAQGQASINLSKTSKLLQKCSDGQVSKAREVVKKVNVPSKFSETKINVLSDINAELENRYLQGQLANKSAQESSVDILRLSPVDLGAKKEELKEKYGQKIQDKEVAEKEQRALEKKYSIMGQKMRQLEGFLAYMLPNDHFIVENPPIKQRVPRMLCKEEGLEAFSQAYVDKIIASYNADGLVKILSALDKESIYNQLDKDQKEFLSESIKSQLEFLNYKKGYESDLGEGAAERSAAAIEEEEERLSDLNAEKENRYLNRQLGHKSAEKSAADILRLSPTDLGAKKIELQEKYGDKIQEKKDKAELAKLEEKMQLEAEEAKIALDERIQKMHDFACFLSFPGIIRVPSEVCEEQGMEAFIQSYVDNMVKSYHPSWLVQVLESIDKEDPIRNPLDDDQKDMLRQAIKSELEFINYKKQFESNLPKGAAKKSAETILQNSPVDLGQRKIDLQEKFSDKLKNNDE